MPALPLALGVVIFFDVLRVFLPSLITLFGRAGETPAELMGAYAALWFVLPFLAALLRPTWCLYGGAAALVLSRLVLQTGAEQLYTASIGVSAGLVFLYGCARLVERRAVPVGLAGGLAASVVAHLLLDHVDLVWRDGVLPWLGAVTVCLALLASLAQVKPSDDPAPAATWFLFGPALLLIGMFLLTPAPHDAQPPEWIPMANAFTSALGVLTMLFLSWSMQRSPFDVTARGVIPFALLLGVALTVLDGGRASSPLICVGLGMGLALTARLGPPARRQGGALLGGLLLFVVAAFVYYGSYDLDLGVPNVVVPSAVAVAAAYAGWRGSSRIETPPAGRAQGLRLARPILGLAVLAVAVGVSAWRPVPDEQPKQGDTLTLIAYNIRMGFGLDGRLSLDPIAEFIAAARPDVVLLSEVDRGWLLNGGHDDLARIAKRVGMRYHFAPAADARWGDALLTNLPAEVKSYKLSEHDYPTGAQAQAIVVKVGTREVGIVNTHLQAPKGQAFEAMVIARNLAAGLGVRESGPHGSGPMEHAFAQGPPRPVILAGDLNIPAGDPGMKVFEEAGLTDPLTALGNPLTSPAGAPVKRIDHVLVTKGVEVRHVDVPRLPYSDHLPVVASLRLTSDDQGG